MALPRGRTILAVSLVVVGLCIAAGMFTLRTLGNSMCAGLLRMATEKGLSLHMASCGLQTRSLVVSDMSLLGAIKRIPISLKAERLTLSFAPLSLLRGIAEIRLLSDAYSGHLDANGAFGFSDKSFKGSLAINQFALSQHPAITALGIVSGTLTLDAPEINCTFGQHSELCEGAAHILLANLAKPFATVISKGVSVPISIPPVKDLRAEGRLRYGQGRTDFDAIELGGSLGTLHASGYLLKGSPGAIELQGRMELSADGRRAFGPILSSLSGGKLSPESSAIVFSIAGAPGSPTIELGPKEKLGPKESGV